MKFFRRMFVTAVVATTLSVSSCNADTDSADIHKPTTTTSSSTPNAQHQAAYKYFLSPERTRKIDDAIKACGDPLLNQLTTDAIPARASGGEKDKPAPKSGLGLVYSDPSYAAPKGQAISVALTVYFADGKVTEVHGVELQHGDAIYTLRGWRVARPDGRHTDNGVDAYTWETRTGDAQLFAVMLAEAGTLTPSRFPASISSSDNFDVLHVGYSEEDASNHFTATNASTLQVLDEMFLQMFNDACK